MKTGAGLALICVGAILAFAVTASPPFINIHVAGAVLILIGLVGLVMPRRTYGWLGRRVLVRRTRAWPGNERGETITVPPSYVARNPGTSRAEAGLPPTPSLSDEAPPRETEVIEDLYEQ
jgi:hypothetical protein